MLPEEALRMFWRLAPQRRPIRRRGILAQLNPDPSEADYPLMAVPAAIAQHIVDLHNAELLRTGFKVSQSHQETVPPCN